MTDKEIEEAALEHAHQCFSYNASGDAERHKVHIQNQRDSFLAGAFHMQPKIAELEWKLKISMEALEEISGDIKVKCIRTVDGDLAKEALEKIGEGNGKE